MKNLFPKNVVELTVGKIILYPEMKILVCGSKKSRPRFSIEKVNGFRKKECGKSIENVVEKSEVSDSAKLSFKLSTKASKKMKIKFL